MDSVDWEKVGHATADEIANTIEKRGMHKILANRIKAIDFCLAVTIQCHLFSLYDLSPRF